MNLYPTQDIVPDVLTRRKSRIYAIALALIVVILDFLSKRYILSHFFYGESRRVIDDFFRITFITNPNALFGIPLGKGPVYVISAILAIGVLLFLLLQDKTGRMVYLYALFIGGALGNLIDRIRFGQVVDFIDIGIGKYRWPVFNFADSAITIGILVYIFLILKNFKGGKHGEESGNNFGGEDADR